MADVRIANQVVASDRFLHYSFNPDDIVTGEGRLLASEFPVGCGMKRFATPGDKTLRAGFTRFSAGARLGSLFWYKETWFIISGSATLIVDDKGTESTTVLKAGDATFFPEGIRFKVNMDQGEDLVFMYVAVPASNRDAHWIGTLTPDEVAEIKGRT
jgi:uncharacterized cupin superfamily protein